jgi:hypothetical protein
MKTLADFIGKVVAKLLLIYFRIMAVFFILMFIAAFCGAATTTIHQLLARGN